MTAFQLRQKRHRLQARTRRQRAERRGSTLLIVLVLMAMLASLGVIFYVFAAQERASANYYSDAAKAKQFDISADTLFDFGVRQLIEGPDIGKFQNSALSKRRHALLPNMLGLDTSGSKLDFAPFNGRLLYPTDTNYSNFFVAINDSDGANPTQFKQQPNLANLDPDYTYPDVYNVFMSYDGYEPFGTGYAGGTNDGALGRRRIIIPSFHRPQLASIRGSHGTAWFDSAPANQVLRPHSGHQYVGSRGPTGTSRYLTNAAAQALWGSNVVGFPITPPRDPSLGLPAARTLQLGQQGVWSLSAAPTSSSTIVYEYDVDNDGDGIWEGVWLDLDFPPLEDSTGQLYVPMYSFTVKDADALLNLNVHGNMARVWNANVNLDTVPFGGPSTADGFISKSNQGISASEVNPLWAFNRRPPTNGGIVSTEYDGSYGADPFFGDTVGAPAPVNWKEAANRDWLYLLMGRYSTAPSDLVPGRWGEEHLLYRAITNTPNFKPRYFSVDPASPLNNPSLLTNPWPGPGQTQYDDNGDRLKITGDFFGSAYQPFGKPLDYTGLGSYWNLTAGTAAKQGNYGGAASGFPGRWPIFTAYSNSSQASTVQWPTSALASSVQYEGLFNDAGEMVIDADAKKDEDAIFGAEEMQALHLSASDFGNVTGGQSRLTQLAPYNLTATTSTVNSGLNKTRDTQEFRSKFTTRSWDRKQFSITPYPAASPLGWQFAVHSYVDSTGTTRYRTTNGTAPSANPRYFPPQFGGASGATPYLRRATAVSMATPGSADLFRPVLRRLLEVQENNTNQPTYQLRLNLNQLLVGPNGNPDPTFQHPSTVSTASLPPNIQLSYRPLTPHADQTTLGATAIGTQPLTYPANGNFTSPQQQEFWARVDRQMMARDIFSLLYTLCWPDGTDPATSTTFGTTASNQAMIRQFAQYAVNLVDSVDRDNIVTKFECDINPNDGWGLDDDPYSSTGDVTAQRFVVYGVEQTGLTLSEAAAARSNEVVGSNLGFTEWDDDFDNGTHFAYVELRNPGPGTVSFNNRAWRIEVGPDFANKALFATATNYQAVRRLDLRAGSVTEGNTYTIGSTDNPRGASAYPSVMKVGLSGSAPANWDTDTTSWIMPAQKPLDLDLKLASQSTNYVLTDGTSTTVPTGALYDNTVFTMLQTNTTPLYFRLYRRASPDRPFPSSAADEADNPFVLVDEIAIHNSTVVALSDTASTGPRGQVTFTMSDMAADITAKLANLRSRERAQPFSTLNTNGYLFHTPSGPYGNTLNANNGNSPSAFTNWQKVFDRDFASVGELLHVTLGGYSNTIELNQLSAPVFTYRVPLPGLATGVDINGTYTTMVSDTTSATTTVATIPSDAEILFRPTAVPTGGSGLTTTAPRWHRLLDMVEVPSRMQAAIPGFPNPVDYSRVPGKININMLRHPEVLAALLDDPTVMSLQVDEDADLSGSFNGSEDATSASGNGINGQLDVLHPPKLWRTDNGNTESWWQALLASRDGGRNGAGLATYDATTQLYLPGTDKSVPFRGFTQAAGTIGNDTTAIGPYADIEHTLLRSWPGDSFPANDTSTNQSRQLWELGIQNEHRGNDGMGNPVQTLDPYVRSRLLNKLMNNVTTRSNVFVVFASVKFFRANRTASGAVQIGGPLKAFDNVGSSLPANPPDRTDSGWQPEYKRFYVIDRSQIEKAYDPQSKTFNFRALIEFQQNLPASP